MLREEDEIGQTTSGPQIYQGKTRTSYDTWVKRYTSNFVLTNLYSIQQEKMPILHIPS